MRLFIDINDNDTEGQGSFQIMSNRKLNLCRKSMFKASHLLCFCHRGSVKSQCSSSVRL